MTCVTSPYFIVKVNEEGHGCFVGKRGLRQGDPMSALLCVLVIEYMTRVLKRMSDLPDFKFHPMYKALRFTHLIFVDNLMIFCKGGLHSVNRVMEALQHFSLASRLVANMEKSSIFFVGVNTATKYVLLEKIGFSKGSFPIIHLGLPLSPKKMEQALLQTADI
ncbi:uncharacterized protein LOC107013174 [Solanum pennellii]|uniref:Uncharacterized protein LOC107013174 n=1 Tax=Solanum pennellii TaxID=28526 RepID=A0ABM1GBF7_SOLPN|nr:uncharacterized protein LOC107013174 [Solanum pennellii]